MPRPTRTLLALLLALTAVVVAPGVTGARAQTASVQPSALRTFVPVTPTRMMDTRTGLGGTALQNGETRLLDVTGAAGVPNWLPTAAVMNVTITNPDQAGFLTVFPANAARPVASNLNFAPGQTVPNLGISGVDGQGRISIFNALGTADEIADAPGWNQ